MFSLCDALWQFVETSMDSSMTWWSSLGSVPFLSDPCRWKMPWHQLPLHGWLCGPRLLLRWDSHPPCGSEGALQRQSHNSQRQPRVKANYSGVRLLWWVLKKVRECECLEVLHWPLWLSTAHCSYRIKGVLPARRPLPQSWLPRLN